MSTRLGIAVAAVLLLGAAPASAQRIDPFISMEVDDHNCGAQMPVRECVVPSGSAIDIAGRIEIRRDPVVGAPIRVMSGPTPIVQTATDADGRFKGSFVPLLTGTNFQVEILHGGTWQVLLGTVARATVFVDLVGIGTSVARGYPLSVHGRITWFDRVGVGKLRLLRCRYTRMDACTEPADFTRTIATKRLRAKGGSRFRLNTRKRAAYGRRLALRYEPDNPTAVQGDFMLLRRYSPRQR